MNGLQERIKMPTPFSILMKGIQKENEALTLHVPEDWLQGRTVFGGLQAAFALRAMRELVPQLPLRTLQATFLAPVEAGQISTRAQILRQGKGTTFVEARIVDGSSTLALLVGTFGAPRKSGVEVIPQQSPLSSDSSRGIEFPFIPGLTPSFTQHFGVKLLKGNLPFTGDREVHQILELRMKEEGQATEGHVLVIADFIPPIALSHLKTPAPGSTLTWMLEMLTDDVSQLGLSDWRIDAHLLAAQGGQTSQKVMIWGPGGTPIATSQQSMMVFG